MANKPEESAPKKPSDLGSIFTIENGRGEKLDISAAIDEWPSRAAAEIMTNLVAKWAGHFLAKNMGYGDAQETLEPADKVQFLDIHRKVHKLKRALWDNLPIWPEDVDEVAYDLIGHLFLLLYVRAKAERDDISE